ncbi:MAG TPA: roadblock/LC7 domain-containing protein [Desulfuromonadaceae bacterium]|jgi:predicted regulator of Ras-like GTPase activity (Roadblock/LC7/MglB family)
MQDILQHINNVEGVIGSAVFSEKGVVVAHSFPALIDRSALEKAAGLALECAHGLQIAQTLDVLDLRYVEGRIIIKTFSGAMLCLLCSKAINMQVLNITLNLATKKLESKLPKEAPPEPASASSPAEAVADGKLFLTISHLANREASMSFDSLGMIAVSSTTAKDINDFYSTSFKKLNLLNSTAGTKGTFPVMVMNDMDSYFDGTIIVGPGIEKKLKVSEGDKIEVNPV